MQSLDWLDMDLANKRILLRHTRNGEGILPNRIKDSYFELLKFHATALFECGVPM